VIKRWDLILWPGDFELNRRHLKSAGLFHPHGLKIVEKEALRAVDLRKLKRPPTPTNTASVSGVLVNARKRILSVPARLPAR